MTSDKLFNRLFSHRFSSHKAQESGDETKFPFPGEKFCGVELRKA
jgi:hypothetical protein